MAAYYGRVGACVSLICDGVRMAPVFVCKKCGCCCQGRGGIVLSNRDLARLAAFLGISEEAALGAYVELSNGKRKIRAGDDGYCCFFRHDAGCTVHEGKPDICRAWPFFRGNLLDEVSFALAKEYCLGIDRDADFATFRREGLAALRAADLQTGADAEANALKIEEAAFGQLSDVPSGLVRKMANDPPQNRLEDDFEDIFKDMGGRHGSAHEAD